VALAEGGLEAISLDRVESELALRNRVEVGTRLPLFAGGGTKALLAFQPEAIQETVIHECARRLAVGTRTAPDELRQDLARVRRDGYWIALEEYADGADAIGAAVFDATGAAVAGVSITGPVSRLRQRLVSPELRGPLVDALLEAMRGLSRQLGYTGVYPPAWPLVQTRVPSEAAA
jgi:DNA-binding IclR family transcriptional regulator